MLSTLQKRGIMNCLPALNILSSNVNNCIILMDNDMFKTSCDNVVGFDFFFFNFDISPQ